MYNREIGFGEIYICGLLCCLGIFEAGHLIGLLLGLSVAACGKIILAMLIMFGLTGMILLVKCREVLACRLKNMGGKYAKTVIPMLCIFLVLFAMQTFYICREPLVQTAGDITLETVNTFLATDRIYAVSPLTGQEYSGSPLRYKILCLPTIYALVCKWFGMEPQILVGRVVPLITLSAAYGAYYLLSGALFGRHKEALEKRFCFLTIVAVIFFFYETVAYTEGYGVLHAGWLGTTIRNSILLPFLLYGVLEKRWLPVVLCLLAEICIAWTFWGMGVCAAMLAGLVILEWIWSFFSKKGWFSFRSAKEENDR